MAGIFKGWDGSIMVGANSMVKINSWELSLNQDMLEDTDFGDSFERTFVAGKRNFTATINGFYHTTDAAQLAVLNNFPSTKDHSSATVILLTNSTTGTKAGWTGSALFPSVTVGAPADNLGTLSITAQFTGGLDTYST